MPDLDRPSTARTEEAEPRETDFGAHGVFVDQGRKLRYLIYTRGDRRAPRPLPGEEKRPVRRRSESGPARIKNQATLAEALAVDNPTVSRWTRDRTRIPADQLTEICRVFEVDELKFRTLGFAAFCEACEAPVSSRPALAPPFGLVPPVWHRLMREAVSDHVWIVLSDPRPDVHPGLTPISSRHARVLPEDPAASPIVEVAADTFFWVEISSPPNPNGSPRWGGWRVLMFSRDPERGSFKCILPRYETHSAFGKVTIPNDGHAVLIPRTPVLKHDRDDLGEFEMIVLPTKDDLPADIMDALASDDTAGAMLEITLQALGELVDVKERQATAALAKVRYRVIAMSPE